MIGLGELFDKSIKAYKEHFFILIKLSFLLYFIPQCIAIIVHAVLNSRFVGVDISSLTFSEILTLYPPVIIIAVAFGIVNGILSLLMTFTIIKVLTMKRQGKNFSVMEAITWSSPHFFGGILISFLTGLIIFTIFTFSFTIATVIFIFVKNIILAVLLYTAAFIPGIIVAIYLTFTIYAYIVDELSFKKSWLRSIEVVKDNWWRVLFYFIALGGLLIIAAIVIQLLIIPFSLIGYLVKPYSFIASDLIVKIPATFLMIITVPFSVVFAEILYLNLRVEKGLYKHKKSKHKK